jgi:hypothetical protein
VGPSEATVLRTLRDGYWDRTEVVQLADGSLRVRKASKGAAAPGPWGLSALRNEIRYLTAPQGRAADHFPKLLAAWDDEDRLGYEMSYVEGVTDAGTIAQAGRVGQAQADLFQDRLAEVIFGLVHVPVRPGESLSGHVKEAIDGALAALERRDEFAPLIDAGVVWLNGERVLGPRRAMQRIVERGEASAAIDCGPQVRLHGDCFLENILLAEPAGGAAWPGKLMLVDPVSVAGVYEGLPLFDLVKYESYATGELLAIRSEKVQIDGFTGRPTGRYVFGIRADDPAVRPFRQVDWHSRFRAAYIRRYGRIRETAYHLLDGYFALVMALCTRGVHQRARLLKAAAALNAAAG